MNKDNAKDFLPLVQALADGKMIQFNNRDGLGFVDCPNPNFTTSAEYYRIKPEPREWYLHVFPDGSASAYTLAQVHAGSIGEIRVREIID